LRASRVAPVPVQLALPDLSLPDLSLPDSVLLEPVEPWWELPEATRVTILALLARLIARCVLLDDAVDGGQASDG
jgi:hypothetical protein